MLILMSNYLEQENLGKQQMDTAHAWSNSGKWNPSIQADVYLPSISENRILMFQA